MTGLRHLLMTTDAVGGVWTYAIDLARELTGAGVQVTLAVLGPDPSDSQFAQARAAAAELVLLGGELDWTATSPAEVDFAGVKLGVLAARVRPDIVHLNNPAFGANVRFPAPVVAVCHSCVKTWWATVKPGSPLPPDLAWRAKMTGRGYGAAAVLVAPSQAFAEATQRAYGLAAAPWVVQNGRTSPSTSLGGAKAPGGFVFTAGRLWDEGKDIATLDRAAARLDLKVVAAGSVAGPNAAPLAFEHLELIGRLEEAEVAKRLSQRPIFVSTAVYEPFGLAVLEAAQAGCPLVLADIATFRELWDGAAVFFPPGDDAALGRELQSLGADTARCAALGGAARGRAKRYTAAGFSAAMADVYRQALAASRDGRAVA